MTTLADKPNCCAAHAAAIAWLPALAAVIPNFFLSLLISKATDNAPRALKVPVNCIHSNLRKISLLSRCLLINFELSIAEGVCLTSLDRCLERSLIVLKFILVISIKYPIINKSRVRSFCAHFNLTKINVKKTSLLVED